MRKFTYLVASLIMVALVVSCSKDQSDPTDVSLKVAGGGNIDCSLFLPCTFAFSSGNIDYVGGVNEGSFGDINWSYDPIEGTVTWWSDVYVNVAFIVKGGPASNYLFEGCGECSKGGVVDLPLNPNNKSGKRYGLSHIAICYNLCEQPDPVVLAVKCFYEPGINYASTWKWALSGGAAAEYPFISSTDWCSDLGFNTYPDVSAFPLLNGYNGQLVGEVTIVEIPGSLLITVTLKDDNLLNRTHLYAGATALSGTSCPVYTAAPWQLIDNLNVDNSVTFTVPYLP